MENVKEERNRDRQREQSETRIKKVSCVTPSIMQEQVKQLTTNVHIISCVYVFGLTFHAIVGESLTELIHHNEKYTDRISQATWLQ